MNRITSLTIISLFALNFCFGQDTIHWKPNYKLQWKDFQANPDTNSKYKAISNLSIGYKFSYKSGILVYNVVNVFNKKKSWTKLKDSLLLSHEQSHFDINEIFTRKFEQLLKAYAIKEETIKADIKEMYEKIKLERDLMNTKYDKETNFSKNIKKQYEWNYKIAQELRRFKE